MALPLEPSPQAEVRIRRLVVLLSLWQARQSLGRRSAASLREAERTLELDGTDREVLARLEGSAGRFSFYDRRAANWIFGAEVAAIVGRARDWSVAAPAAAWAIHALNAADELARAHDRGA